MMKPKRLALAVKEQAEMADDLATELVNCGHDDIGAFDILDGLASCGYVLMRMDEQNLASIAYLEEMSR